jgi:hypothetical protein
MQQTLFYHLSYVDENNERHIFYIGRTGLSLAVRLAQHKSAAKRKNTTNLRFIRELLQRGYAIEITEVHQVDSYERKIVEVEEDRLIREYLAKGCQLTNKGTGGFGLVPGECQKEVLWTQEMECLLGVVSDREIAQRFNITRYAVMKRRAERDIAALAWTEWTPEMDTLLGSMTDVELGKYLGICYQIVNRRRKHLGIPVYHKPDPWTKIDPLIGTIPDREVALKFGYSTGAIAKRRRLLGIPPFSS